MQKDGEALDEKALEISLVNDLREIARVAVQIDDFCAARDLGPQVAYAVNLSIDEILTNTISYRVHDENRIESRSSCVWKPKRASS